MTAFDAFDSLADEPRWVAWRNERRGGRLTKVPYAPMTEDKAKADDPATWGTRAEAENRARKLINGKNTGGIGVELGDCGADVHLGGLDLDSCLDAGTPVAWAQAIIDAVPSYGEISPSGAGVKLFFYVATEDVRPFLELIGCPAEQWGCRRTVPGFDGRNHGPAVEIYLSHRYFAVTGNRWPSLPDLVALLDSEALQRLAKLIPPPAAASRTGDNSRSAKAFRKGAELRRGGKTFDEMVAALEADPDTADWVREKGHANNDRELYRIWERAAPNTSATAAVPPQFSDEALALEFSRTYAPDLRYVALLSKWLLWGQCRWEFEETLKAFDLARTICRNASATVPPKQTKLAAAVASARTVAAVERLARADRRHATEISQWDHDLGLFNTVTATIDLDTGIGYPPRREDYITKQNAIAVDPHCPIPRWLAFLDRVTNGDRDLQAYIRRLAGYCMTGHTGEHVMFFLYGAGANGKSVFINTLRGIWGDYAAVAPMETFIETHNDRHPTELAHLRGARLVVAYETERGRRWAESKIKAMTGGDPIPARFMRQDFFTYDPQFKIVVAGNHKPSLRGVDEAIRRRLHLIPFTITIPPHERDKEMFDKLKPEWPGILQWALGGCLEWQKFGLAPPKAVLDASEAYFAEEDLLGNWIEERCAVDKAYSQQSSELFASWKSWGEAAGERPGSQKGFAQNLEKRGFQRHRDRLGTVFFGIALKP